MTADALLKCSLWRNGPVFLQRSEQEWPRIPLNSTRIEPNEPEVKKERITVNVITETHHFGLDSLMHHYSSWNRILRAVAWLLKFKRLLQNLCLKRKEVLNTIEAQVFKHAKQNCIVKEMNKYKASFKASNLSADDLRDAEFAMICYCQDFVDELSSLKKGLNVKKDSSIFSLDPRIQDGLLRVGGRLRNSAMPVETKNPAILPKNHHISKLLIKYIHQQTGHSGQNYVLSSLRQKYWIPCANSLTRKIISECITCRRHHAPMGEQKMADLPKDRITPDLPPFTYVGADYFGPIEVNRGRCLVKRYGVIFTCLVSRAVHLEISHSLDTDSCINALRRFVCRRGQVKEIRSDNGTNLVATEKELKQALKEWNLNKIESALTQQGIKWIFNPPAGSHYGGVWERLIRMIKKILLSVTRQQTLDDESLETVMCEVEAILNNRPLTTTSGDPNDLEPLTPNHLLQLKVQPSFPPGVFQKDDLYSRRRWRQVQYISDLFWTRRVKEYLPMMQARQKWNRTKRNFKVGDIVLVADANAPRGLWIIGRILEARTDSKGHVRSV